MTKYVTFILQLSAVVGPEKSKAFVARCSHSFIASLPPASRDLLFNGDLVELIFESNRETCEALVREFDAYFATADLLFRMREPEEHAAMQKCLRSFDSPA